MLDKQLWDFVANNKPDLWRRCYPRIYEEPNCGKYYSAKEVSYQLLSAALRIAQEGASGQTQIAEILWASRLANLHVPIYWIGHDMAQAIQQTVPPVEFDWSTTELPFDAMVFMMPKGFLVHETPEEGEAMFVSFVRVKQGDEIATLSPGGPCFYNIMGDTFSCFATTTGGLSGRMLLHWTYTADHGDDLRKVNLAELDKLVGGFSKHPHTSHSMYSASLTMADNRFMARVCHFVFGTLLLMLTKPDFVTRATLRNRVPGKAQQAPKEFWTPNVLGLHYRIRRLAVPLGGTHASPKGHWVRGAYKEQPYGEKLALRKRRWIAPYWRGGEF